MPDTGDASAIAGVFVVRSHFGQWVSSENGVYTINVTDAVTDVAGNHVTARTNVGTVTVNVTNTTMPPTGIYYPTMVSPGQAHIAAGFKNPPSPSATWGAVTRPIEGT